MGEDRPDPPQAGQGRRATKPAAAPHYAVAGELYLKYRPDAATRARRTWRRAVEIDPRQKRAELLLERLYRAGGRVDDLAKLYERRVGLGRSTTTSAPRPRCWRARWRWSRARTARPSSTSSGRWPPAPAEPRALHRVVAYAGRRDENWAELAKVYENALRVHQARPGRAGAAGAAGHRHLAQARQPRSGRAVLPAHPQGRAHPPGADGVLPGLPHPPRRDPPAAGAVRPGPEGRDRPREAHPPRHRDGRAGRAAAAVGREGHRRLEEPAAHAAGPARGGDRAAPPLHQDREVERAARDVEGRSRGAAQGRRRREDRAATWR